jgi:RNA polymerase sigma factor (sigma-70 family)
VNAPPRLTDTRKWFADFYRKNYRLVVTVAEHRLGSLHDAEEIAADAFRIAFEHQQAGGRLTVPWLYVVVRNLVSNEYRRRARRQAVRERLAAEPCSHSPGPDAASDAIEVRSALRTLPGPQRELLVMIYWDELTMAEAAKILDTTPGTVRVRVLRARRALAAKLRHLS